MREAAALCIVDRSEQALRLVQNSLDQLPFLWLTGWDNTLSVHLKKVCRCQHNNHPENHGLTVSLHTVRASPISGSILWTYCLRLTADEEEHKEKRNGTSRLCRHTRPPQHGAPLWSPWLGGRTVDAERARQGHSTGALLRCHHPWVKNTFFYKYYVWQYLRVSKHEMRCVHHLENVRP